MIDPILAYVTSFIGAHGYSPTVREIAAGCGIKSTSTAQLRLQRLVKNGHLVIERGRCRTIRVPV